MAMKGSSLLNLGGTADLFRPIWGGIFVFFRQILDITKLIRRKL